MSDHEYDTDGDSIASHVIGKRNGPSGTKSKRRSLLARQEALEDDIWTLQVEKGRVQCRGCSRWIQLSKKEDYNRTNWIAHKNRCGRVTGFQRARTSANKPTKLLAVSCVSATRLLRSSKLIYPFVRRKEINL